MAILLAGTLLSLLKKNESHPPEEHVDLDESHPLEEGTFLDDRFDTGLDNWSYWGGQGYVLEWVSNTTRISGDGWLVEGGMQKVVDLSTWDESGMLLLSFDFRATSGTADSCVTQATLWIQDADSGSSLNFLRIVYGGTIDTGWRFYVTDISTNVLGHSRIRIILYVGDGWSADWQQTNFYDNIKLTST